MTGLVTGVLAGLVVAALAVPVMAVAARFVPEPPISVGWSAAAVAAAVVLGAGHGPVRELTPLAWMALGLAALSAVDAATHLLPNRLLYPVGFVGAGLIGIAAAVAGDVGMVGRAAVGLLVGLVPLAVVWFVAPSGLGFGDVRLGGLLGMFVGLLGPLHVITALLIGSALASVTGLGLAALGRRDRSAPLPFGPYLALGAVVVTTVSGIGGS